MTAETDDGLTREMVTDLVKAIVQRSLPRKFAATTCGVSPKTFERWIARGATGTGQDLHTELARRVFEAEGGKIGTVMSALHMMCEVDPKAGETFLKMFKPADFGGPKRVADEFDDAERHAEKRDKLLDNPPPRLRAVLTRKGWWQFTGTLSAEDVATLVAIQERCRGPAPFALGEPAPSVSPAVSPPPSKPPPKPKAT